MKNIFKAALILSIFASASSYAENFRGRLSKKNDKTYFETEGQSLIVEIDKRFKYALDDVVVNSPGYIFEFEGEVIDGSLHTSKVPTIFAGTKDLNGHFTKDSSGQLFINEQKVKFGRTKVIYNDSFDKFSKEYYLNKDVVTQGHYEDDTFVINAIVEKGLISAEAQNQYPPSEEFSKDPEEFILKKMPLNKYSQSSTPFRGTIINKKNYDVEVGESVLIITLSGRQGDAPGSAAGHFTVGMGEVQEDMSIKGEVFNFYFVGPKEVLAGNTDLTSYFGHLIQGQQNYRPTYTLYAYGVDKKKLRSVRDQLEKENHKVRTVKGLEITPGYNCTTTSTNELKKIGIVGNHQNILRSIFDVQNISYINPFSYGARNSNGQGTLGMIRTLSYTLSEDPENYIPRAAFESFVKNFSRKSQIKKMGIKKVDYVFIPQTKSKRQVGGISYDDPIKEGKKVLDFDKLRSARIENERKAREILNNSTSTEEEILWAREISENEVSWEEDQKMVREFLYNTID
ncbi:hypothetical protein [Halobacteriovorax sp. HLS]|uniref:hypothetical protein n=1 Tax=Halobacteriovorax sp. HLS TaxID=2234000 RepID=UPI000FDCB810|nr:hypothetical protein [Halobacteriovorax sp. HLS]